MPNARPTMLASASGELNTRVPPKRRCRPCVTLKTPPLPDTSASASSRLQSATSSPNTTMRGLCAISSRSAALMALTIVSGLPLRLGGHVERRRRSDRRRVRTPSPRRCAARACRPPAPASVRLGDLPVHVGQHRRQVVFGRQAFGQQQRAHAHERVALRFVGAFGRGLVQPLVVGQRVRVRPRDLCVNQRRALAVARPLHRLLERRVARDEVAAVHAQDLQVGEALDQARDVAAGRLRLDRHRDRVAVVLDQVDDRQPLLRRRVERLPELAFAGGAVAERAEDDLVCLKVLARGRRSPSIC